MRLPWCISVWLWSLRRIERGERQEERERERSRTEIHTQATVTIRPANKDFLPYDIRYKLTCTSRPNGITTSTTSSVLGTDDVVDKLCPYHCPHLGDRSSEARSFISKPLIRPLPPHNIDHVIGDSGFDANDDGFVATASSTINIITSSSTNISEVELTTRLRQPQCHEFLNADVHPHAFGNAGYIDLMEDLTGRRRMGLVKLRPILKAELCRSFSKLVGHLLGICRESPLSDIQDTALSAPLSLKPRDLPRPSDIILR